MTEKPLIDYHNIFKSKESRNQIVFCDFCKAQNYLGQNWVKSDMPGHAYKESNTIRVFHFWYYITILNAILNGQTVLEIFKFEKSSNLIGREHFGQ